MPTLDDDPQSCGFPQHNPPPQIAFAEPSLYWWRCPACGLKRIFALTVEYHVLVTTGKLA